MRAAGYLYPRASAVAWVGTSDPGSGMRAFVSDWSDEETGDPVYADDRNFYKSMMAQRPDAGEHPTATCHNAPCQRRSVMTFYENPENTQRRSAPGRCDRSPGWSDLC